MAATLKCKLHPKVFHCGLLARCCTCLRVEYRTGCRFHASFIARCFQSTSPSSAAFQTSASFLYRNSDATLMRLVPVLREIWQ